MRTGDKFILALVIYVILSFALLTAVGVFLPRNVCEDKPYMGGTVKVCHVEPSIYSRHM